MKQRKIRLISFLSVLACFVMLMETACKKYETPESDFEELTKVEQKADTTIVRKVLMVNIDGAVGEIVEQLEQEGKLTNIASILPHSKYSWNGLSTYSDTTNTTGEEDPVTWASLMTGVVKGKHKITNNSYIPNVSLEPGKEYADLSISYYPTFLYRIREYDSYMHTLCVTPWRNLNEQFLNDAYKTITSGSDEETKDTVAYSLKKEDYTFSLASFKGVLEAGKQSGFSADNGDYVSALNTIDGYIGELLEAIKSRKTYDREEWLVVITSNDGGSPDGSYGGSSDEERNTFTLFYYPNFSEVELHGTTIDSPNFNSEVKGVAADYAQKYSLGLDDTLTVQMILHINANPDDGSYGWSHWDKLLGKENWGLYRKDKDGTEFGVYVGGWAEGVVSSFTDGWWHSFTVSMMYDSDGTKSREFKMYYDGELTHDATFDFDASVVSSVDTSDFVLGGSPINFNIAELRIWDTELSVFDYSDNACLLDMPSSQANYKHLIGYWNFTDRSSIKNDTIVKNEIPGMPDLILSQPLQFTKSANTLACNMESDNIVVENETIAPQILYWLNITIQSKWEMGRPVFLSEWSNEIYQGD